MLSSWRDLRDESIRLGETELVLRRPVSPEALIDEDAFAHDEFLPYWAELWPAATALAESAARRRRAARRRARVRARRALARRGCPRRGGDGDRLVGRRDRAAACERRPQRPPPGRRGAGLASSLGRTASTSRSRRMCSTSSATWRRCSRGCGSSRPQALVGLAGRPYEAAFLAAAGSVEQVAERVVLLTRAS